MTTWLAAAAFCAALCLAGLPWAAALVPVRRSFAAHAALAYLVGAALTTLAMLGLALAGLAVTRLGVLACMAAAFATGALALRLLPARRPRPPAGRASPFAVVLLAAAAAALALVLAVAVTAGPIRTTDFVRAWGLKGVVVFAQHDLDFALVSRHWQFYPLGVSNLYGALYLVIGRVDDSVVRLPLALLGVSLAVSMWSLARLVLPPGPAALGVALATTTPTFVVELTRSADAVVACYMTVAALAAFLWTREGDARWAALSGLAAGAAAWAKLEGAPTALVILGGALLVARGGRLRGALAWLAWFGLFVVPWQVYQRTHGIHFASAHFRGLNLDAPYIASHVAAQLLSLSQWGPFWAVAVFVIALTAPLWWHTPWRSLAAVTLPNVLLTAGAYVTHYRGAEAVSYELTTSRLYLHIAPAVALMTAAALHAAWPRARLPGRAPR